MTDEEGETTVDELAAQSPQAMERELVALREALARLQQSRHYKIDAKWEGNTLRFGIISDLHIGSLYEKVDALHAFYDLLRKENIHTVLMAGDIIEGHGIYKGQEFETYAHGYDAQEAAALEKIPTPDDVETYFVTGNHDYSYRKTAGIDIGIRLEERFAHWHYMGYGQQTIDFKTPKGRTFNIGIIHPSGGSAYAISYKAQRIVEGLPGGLKPHVLLIGHFHKAEYLPVYRNVGVLQAGCFQAQTPFMMLKPTPANVGGWIVEAVPGSRKQLTSRLKAEFIAFYEPGEMGG